MITNSLQLSADRFITEKAIHPESLCRTNISGTITGDSHMKKIPLTQGKLALVDDADYKWLNQWKWKVINCNYTCYAARTIYLGGGRKNQKSGTIQMHRLILNAPINMEGDHKDGNGLNNQRSNLRLATSGQNSQNSRK